MISAIGSTGLARTVQLQGDAVARSEPVTRAAPSGSEAAKAQSTPAAEMAAQGAPVDMDKVAAIRAKIADGSYKVDPKAIADKMIAFDLPGSK